jgi:sugar transferase (PEP-CTERM system associated)
MVRLFNHYFPLGTLLLVSLDALFLFAADLLGLLVFAQADPISLIGVLPGVVAFVIFAITFSGALGLYGDRSHDDIARFVGQIALPLAISLPAIHWMFHRLPEGGVSTRAIAGVLLVALVGRVAIFAFTRASTTLINRRILIMGIGPDAVAVKETLEQSRAPGLFIVGYYSPFSDPTTCGKIPMSKILLPSLSISATARQLGVNEIIIAVRERRGGGLPLADLLDCKLKGIKVTDLSGFFENYKSRIRIDLLRESWFIFGEGFRQGRVRMFVKRAFDIFASAALLVVSAPAMILAAIAVKLDGPGPLIYRQERVGLGGKTFNVLKFRSMRADAEVEGKPQWAVAGDSRVTRVGKFMRLTRIDELPQLFTVLKGEMSLVGPRPERPFFVDKISETVPFYAARHSVKPGVTGWAQVRHHYGASVDDASDKLEYDLFYVKNHTLFLDILILFYSVRVVLTAQGAR